MSTAQGLEAITATPSRGRIHGIVRQVARDPSGVFGLTTVGVILIVAIMAPALAPHDPAAINLSDRYAAPSAQHLLGTDALGRDTASRLIAATRTAMEVVLPSVAIALGLGLLMGLVAGYLRGPADAILRIVNDTLQAFPGIVVALVVIAVIGPSLTNEVLVIALTLTPSYFRVSRALMLSAREEVYVDAERALGATTPRVLGHILPNILAPMIVLVAMDTSGVIALDAALSFLGLGVQPPTPSWGGMLTEGFQTVDQSAWPIMAVCAALALATLAFTFLGESLRMVIDPRLSRHT